MRVRKVVTRGGRGFRGNFPSKKLNRVVEFESYLERDAIYLFEYSPGIVSYQEQPEKIIYVQDNKTRKYFPDFELVFKSEKKLHVEVKPEAKLLNPKLAAKFKAITLRYESHEAGFKIFTEAIIRQNPLLNNIKTIAKVRHYQGDVYQAQMMAEKLINDNPNLSFDAFAKLIGYSTALYLLGLHVVVCNLYQDLFSSLNIVRLAKDDDHDSIYF